MIDLDFSPVVPPAAQPNEHFRAIHPSTGRHLFARRGVLLLGIAAYHMLPVAPLPRVDSPIVSVSASLPGADPGTVASSLAAPLEKRLGANRGRQRDHLGEHAGRHDDQHPV